ncbi:DUF1761 domain-containing protein [Halalkalibacter krulwichiae]|uniref:DUF1761 domain-containing protein n=1 Tax=Halalkalibacter krulwichiae TaxID=199441 RepID=A0A1X9MGL8_9BACI|nr:DUF1761 domain-containing protein [Halalkalibacter krulwichiae]ARK32578.1 hypothetical protein BkAM31D_23405 [Halalkalibacter krulwichiae]
MMLLAILTGVVIYMASGMVYYSILGNRWVELLKIKPEQPNYGLLTLVTFLTSTVLYSLLRLFEVETLLDGAFIGGAVGIIVALAYAKDFIFGLGANSLKASAVFVIAVGYHVIALTIIGAVMMLFL